MKTLLHHWVILLATLSSLSAASLSDLTYEVKDDHVVITDCNILASGPLNIPSTIEGQPVTVIGEQAFQICQNLSSITLPSSLRTIEREAFWGTTITSLTIPASVDDIQASALVGTRRITALSVASDNPSYEVQNGIIYSEDLSTLVAYPVANNTETFTIPESVTRIAGGAFEGNLGLLELTPSSNLSSIGPRSFAFTRLAQVALPDSLLTLESEAYLSCSNLETVSFGANLSSIGSQAFQDCPLLSSLQIPDSVSTIGPSAFEDCRALSSVTLGSGLLEISDRLFFECSSLQSITLTSQLTSVGQEAFESCLSLGSITLPDSISNLGSSAFANCTSLGQIDLPNSLDKISARTFFGCRSLQSVQFGPNTKSIGDAAFHSCLFLQSPTFPSTLESIGATAFLSCSFLRNLVIPNKVNSIAQRAFFNSGIRSLTFENSPTELGSFAFSNCSSLTSIDFGDQITTLPDGAFQDCTSLQTATLPPNLSSFTPTAFQNCSSLDTLTLSPDNPNFSVIDNTLFSKNLSTLLMVPAGISNPTFQVPASVTTIGESAFAYCLNFTEIILPTDLEIIEARAFFSCQNLGTLVLPSFLQEIGELAFHRCQSLTRINIPADITHLPTQAFSQLTSLNELFFHGNIPTLGEELFLDSPLNFQVVIHPTSAGFQDTFENRPVTIANLPTFPTPVVTQTQFVDSNLRISLQATNAPLLLYSSSDLKTWTRVRDVPFTNGSFLIPQDHPTLTTGGHLFRVRISSD